MELIVGTCQFPVSADPRANTRFVLRQRLGVQLVFHSFHAAHVPARELLYDSTRDWRARAMRGVLHTGTLSRAARSRTRTEL